ncbi:hypothetical protein IW261DRAFT_1423552 [Armillaria novae-zelandiae]|uniref:Uncharacterized protein n=1 Tax=Armillaria novae-zelandiae TaxID=153914 RepID=A0AA39NXD4_9AGAR|nr:hypothetical protein IW261DRAFT_1423552 [Armillaria novae-zelandiae]
MPLKRLRTLCPLTIILISFPCNNEFLALQYLWMMLLWPAVTQTANSEGKILTFDVDLCPVVPSRMEISLLSVPVPLCKCTMQLHLSKFLNGQKENYFQFIIPNIAGGTEHYLTMAEDINNHYGVVITHGLEEEDDDRQEKLHQSFFKENVAKVHSWNDLVLMTTVKHCHETGLYKDAPEAHPAYRTTPSLCAHSLLEPYNYHLYPNCLGRTFSVSCEFLGSGIGNVM